MDRPVAAPAVATPTASLPALLKATAVPMTLAAGVWAQAPVMHRSLKAPADTTPQNLAALPVAGLGH